MKNISKFTLLLIASLFFTSCFEDRDDNPITSTQINDFVYRAMHSFYVYRDHVPDLVENKALGADYTGYLNSFDQPEALFESLIHDRQNTDRFSWITNDYIALEQQFAGVSTTNGMEFGLRRYADDSDDIYGYVRYILPNTSAENVDLERGDLFYAVNGTPLTVSNWRSLLRQDSYTLNLATYNDNGTTTPDDDSVDATTETVMLTQAAYTKNPVFITDILNVENDKVGYLMYNGFTANFNDQLNDAFATFQSNGVQHLVLDLRYNQGGSVNSASLLGSMVTGQFGNQVFSKLIYNDLQQANNAVYTFSTDVNSLNLGTVYVLTTSVTASASEMVINSLKPYINVIQIGTNTTGKSQASVTLYDSPNFGRTGANPSHTYALQPLVAISVNKFNDEVEPDGLIPDIILAEEIGNLGVLGNENEPLLAAALMHVADNNKLQPNMTNTFIKDVGDSNDLLPMSKEMYIDNE